MPIALIPTLAELELVTGGRSSVAPGDVDRSAVCDAIERSAESALHQGRPKQAEVLARIATACKVRP